MQRLKMENVADYQNGIGMMRIVELLGIAKIAKEINACAYVSIGCGSGGDIEAISKNYKEIPCIGFDCMDIDLKVLHPYVEFYKELIFEKGASQFLPQIHVKIANFLSKYRKGPVLFYTDNGNKLSELKELMQYLKCGDVIGTHDYGVESETLVKTTTRDVLVMTEVFEKDCGFLNEVCLVYEKYEPWVKEHKCLQKFWIKK